MRHDSVEVGDGFFFLALLRGLLETLRGFLWSLHEDLDLRRGLLEAIARIFGGPARVFGGPAGVFVDVVQFF